MLCSVYQAVMNGTGIVTASSKSSRAGLRNTSPAGSVTCEARQPAPIATTSSPTEKPSTPSPTATITPAHSSPGRSSSELSDG